MAQNKVVKVELTKDRQVNDLQRTTDSSTQQLRNGPFGDGNLIKDVTFVGHDTQQVQHGLGRAFQGWVLCRQRFPGALPAAVAEPSGATADPNLYVELYCEVACTVDVWVF